eukprot:4848222-Amphidinium_carterae.2
METIIQPYTSRLRISGEIPPNIILTSESNTLRHAGPLKFGNTGQCAGISTSLHPTARLLHNQQGLGAHRWYDQVPETLGSTIEVFLADVKPITVNRG